MRYLPLSAILLLVSCSPAAEPQIEIDAAWARPTLQAGQSSAAYMVIRNGGSSDDRLIGATSDAAERLTLHSSSNEGGIARMRPIENGLPIRSGSEAELSPGGNHMMLERLKRPLSLGDTIEIRLQFEHAGERTVEAHIAHAPDGAAHQEH